MTLSMRCRFVVSLMVIPILLFSVLYFDPSLWYRMVPNSHCDSKIGSSFRGWDDGVVTVLEPVIQRNCTKIFLRDKWEIIRARVRTAKWRNSLSDEDLFKKTEKCSWVQARPGLQLLRERSFPIVSAPGDRPPIIY